MNIAVLLHSSAGGSGVVATELGISMARLGHNIHFVASQIPFRLTNTSQYGSQSNIFFHQVIDMAYPLFSSPLTTLAEASRLTEVVEQNDIDVIHAHYAIPHATAALMAKDIVATSTCVQCKIPAVVTTLHGTDVTLVGIDPAYLRTTQYAIEKSDVTTAVSQYLADYTKNEMSIGKDIDVIPNSIDAERFRPRANPELRLRYARAQEKILVHISNFREVKRTPDVIKTFAELSPKVPAKLIMIGDGPEKTACQYLANQLGIEDRTIFLNAMPHIEPILAVSDVLLLPSSKESFGLVALEAMASGMPVVGSNIGGIPEVVVDGKTGFLHELGDVKAMAASCLKLLSDGALYQDCSRAARHRAQTKFKEQDVVDLYLAAYQKAVERSQSAQLRP